MADVAPVSLLSGLFFSVCFCGQCNTGATTYRLLHVQTKQVDGNWRTWSMRLKGVGAGAGGVKRREAGEHNTPTDVVYDRGPP